MGRKYAMHVIYTLCNCFAFYTPPIEAFIQRSLIKLSLIELCSLFHVSMDIFEKNTSVTLMNCKQYIKIGIYSCTYVMIVLLQQAIYIRYVFSID